MDEDVTPTDGLQTKSTSSEVELPTSEDGMNGQVAESGRQQENGSAKRSGPARNLIPVKSLTRKKTRKEESLKSWALAEAEPNPCMTCGICSCCCWNGSYDSVGAPLASPDDVFEIMHHSRLVSGAILVKWLEIE